MTVAAATPLRSAVVVGGAGAVGTMFADRLAGSGVEVRILDRVAPPPAASTGHLAFHHGDVLRLDAATLAGLHGADAVLLALPEAAAVQAVTALAPALAPGTLLVDTLSVKAPFAAALRAAGAAHLEAVGLNPMFAPMLGFVGRPVAAVVLRGGVRTQRLLELVESWGGRVVRTTPEEHDRLMAAGQALTHAAVLAFGVALAELDVDIADLTRIAPPPHAMMLGLLARIAAGTPTVYWDVQAANPQAPAARAALARGLRRIAAMVQLSDERAFEHLLLDIREFFGDELTGHGQACARAVEAISRQPSVAP
ncbi:MAG: prephenate dehydrogenase [Actinobacteria bacterium]|nr:prephenate dehydrogenase [Actinomycetota bacterium]